MFLLQTFYPTICPLETDIFIARISPHFLTVERKAVFSLSESSPVTIAETEVVETEVVEIPTPPQPLVSYDKLLEKNAYCAWGIQDSIFWSLYIAVYGHKEYIRLGMHNFGNTEIQEKEKITHDITEKGIKRVLSLTNHKLTQKGFVSMVSDITTNPKSSMESLIAYSIFYQRNIFVVDLQKKTYLAFLVDGQSPPIVLYKNQHYVAKFHKSNEYFVDADQSVMTVQEIETTFFLLEGYERPLKSISNYKMNELEYIAMRFGIERACKKKPELYESIIHYCCGIGSGLTKKGKIE